MIKSAKKLFMSTATAGFMLVAAPSAIAQEGTTLNFEGADLSAFAKEVSLRTGRIFVLDPRLAGQVNVVSPANLTLNPDEVWEVFLATLQVNGYSAVPIGDLEYKIIPSQQAIREGTGSVPGRPASTVTRVVPLRFVNALNAASNLRGLVGETGAVSPIADSNAIIVVDTPSNVSRIVDLIRQFDVDDTIVKTVPLVNAAASEVANTLLEVIGRSGAEGGRRSNQVSVVAVDPSNTIILRGEPGEVNRLIPIVKQLDSEGSGRIALDTIYLNHADAEEIVPILQQLIDNSFGGDAGTAIGGIKPSIAFHKATNSLIVNAPPETQRVIRGIISRLDIQRPQVQIEAIVVEISNTTARELGVQYISGGGDIPVSAATFTNTSPNVVSAAGAAYFLGPGSEGRTVTVIEGSGDNRTETTRQEFDSNDPSNAVAGQLVEAAIGELLSFNGFLIGAADRTDDGTVYGALLSAIQSDSQANVLSVPHATVLDNETALLQVGQEIPIVTGQASGADFQNSFRTVERKDVGNILEVTPQINAGNRVKLKIRLEVSSIGAFTSLTEDIITNKSNIETVTEVEDGQTLILGGLIDQDRRDTESKVPVLGDVPLLGNLFKGQTKSQEESTLMVFIRPTILRDGLTADQVTARKYDYVREQQRQDGRRSDEALDYIMQNFLGPGNYFIPDESGLVSDLPPSVAGEAATGTK